MFKQAELTLESRHSSNLNNSSHLAIHNSTINQKSNYETQ